jgi:hypothetical protein
MVLDEELSVFSLGPHPLKFQPGVSVFMKRAQEPLFYIVWDGHVILSGVRPPQNLSKYERE